VQEAGARVSTIAIHQSTPESGHRAGYNGHKRKKGGELHLAVDTLGHLLALRVTPANVDERVEVAALAAEAQAGTRRGTEREAAIPRAYCAARTRRSTVPCTATTPARFRVPNSRRNSPGALAASSKSAVSPLATVAKLGRATA
jgi:hypothetical protein